ncbi:thiopeptide-type bacteriocin biosynthesis protein [Streptomyces umbrinus]|uniref:Thiopeptide-type bacteriocin biosynthesis protein n=2 Tax=Streptomyces umbrinus TaxID=67370 RepID=A0ABU0T6J2_9ACTN|nr:thiopeptide-type bacteriocin biosynthesis protein [Streptomyces umbrinus]
MSTRPTPFGLFAGVGLLKWAAATDLALAASPPHTRTRPDMAWLLDLVARAERDPAIRAGLRYITHSTVTMHGTRALLPDGPHAGTSIRATKAVRCVLEAARAPTTPAQLANEVLRIPGATPENAAHLVDELCAQGFLLSELHPPLTGGDPASHVRACLAEIPAGQKTACELEALTKELACWDRLALTERAAHWPTLLQRMEQIHPASSDPGRAGKSLLQADMALALQGTGLHATVGAEAAATAELLLRLSPRPTSTQALESYRRAFENRYGPERQVRLLELLDPSTGLGTPYGRITNGGETLGHQERNRLLLTLALQANRDHQTVVELDDEQIACLTTSDPAPENCPLSLDLSLFLTTSSPAALDAGDFQLIVGPNLGAPAAGRGLGRFVELLGPSARAALEEVVQAEQELLPDTVMAELVYAPERARAANVAIRPAIRSHEIVIGSWPGVPTESVVPLQELMVGVRSGRFVVSWPAGGAEVVGLQGHMLNSGMAPVAARFLLDAATDGRCQFMPFSWGPAAGLPFLPRIQRGRSVLSLAQWRLGPVGELGPDFSDRFAGALSTWRMEWGVPRDVYLAVGDNRLLLDLMSPQDVELLREELKGVPSGGSAVVQEALPGPHDAWLPGATGDYLCEIVVPLVQRLTRREAITPASPRPPVEVVEPPSRLRPPGSDWLYLKLYCSLWQQDEVIAGPLQAFGEFATGSGLSDGWYFVRYADPEPHLRIRLHGEPSALIGPLLEQVCLWADDLSAGGMCTKFSFETYEREVERYGGEAGMRAAEAIFTADSPVVGEMLQASKEGLITASMVDLAVISIDDLLDCFGVDPEERARFSYGPFPPCSREGGNAYRERKRALRQVLGCPGAWDAETTRLLRARRLALRPALDLLDSLHSNNLLQCSRTMLHRHYVHLHANRLLGTDRNQERLVLELLRRTRAGLSRAPVEQ